MSSPFAKAVKCKIFRFGVVSRRIRFFTGYAVDIVSLFLLRFSEACRGINKWATQEQSLYVAKKFVKCP